MAKVQSPAARRLLALGNGGQVRGPGTPTSDSIDVRLSDGEFVLPADTVRKVGLKSLRDLVDHTHTPAGKSRSGHYADGGLVDDFGAVTRVGNSYSGMDVRGNITVNGKAPGGTYSENPGMSGTPASAPAPVPATRSVGVTSSPATAPAATPAATPEAAPSMASGTQTAMPSAAPAGWAERNAQRNLEVSASSILPSRARDDAQARLNAMNPPAAAQMPSSATPQPGTPSFLATPATTFGVQPVQSRPLYGTQLRQGFADGGLVTADAQRGGFQSLADRLAQIPVDGYPQAPAADGSQDKVWNTEVGRNVLNTLNALPAAGTMIKAGRMVGAAAQSTGAAREIGAVNAARALAAPAIGTTAVLGAGNTKRPTAAADDAVPVASLPADLAFYNQGELMGPPGEAKPSQGAATAAAPARAPAAGSDAYERLVAMASGSALGTPAVQATSIRHSGNDWQARQDLKNLETSASSIMNRPEWSGAGMGRFRGGQSGMPPAVAAYQAALQTDAALKQAQPGMEQAAMRESAGLQRTGMEQQGANQRAALGALGTADSNEIARGRLSLEQIAAGYQNRSAARLEAAQQAVENAQTPAEQRSARQRLLTLLGKDGEDRWKSVALQGSTDAQGNKTESILGAVNERTGEMRRMPTQAQPAAAPPDGSMVRGKDGRLYEVKNGQPVLVGG